MSGAARLAAPLTRGLGAILMFHHVRPRSPKAFDPNRILEITPEFLDAVLGRVRERGYEIIAMDAVPERLRTQGRPFVTLTFDDGYRDNAEHALPVLRRHAAPFTLYATTGFADATEPLWWRDVEHALAVLPEVKTSTGVIRLGSDPQRRRAFDSVMASARVAPWEQTRALIAALAGKAGLAPLAETARECLDWDALSALAADPLCTVGAHTVSHPLLARMDADAARREVHLSRVFLEERLGRPVRHLSYPVGDASAAGEREFALASTLGFATAVTTRPGVLFAGHADHLHALPRVSVNGLYQKLADFDVLLSGAAFMLFNKGRKLNVS
ncbi:MAG: polysaccharide deacetylase family protein [Beijerinckiaceae bacterium]